MQKNIEKITKIGLLFLLLFSFWGGVIYKAFSLKTIGILSSLLLTVLCFIIILVIDKKSNHKQSLLHFEDWREKWNKNNKKNSLTIAYLFFFLISLLILINFQTEESIISPWQKIPYHFFFFYSLATITLLININKNNPLFLLLISFHYFLSFGIAVIIYKLGYGFDSFVHESTISHIIKNGSIEPRPFYYLGYYSLLVIFDKIFMVPYEFLNKFSTPILASILIPLTTYQALSKIFENKNTVKILLITFLIIPFGILTHTTPQTFSYLLLILSVLLGLTCNNYTDLIIIYLLSLVAIITQPVAGIPAFFYAIFLTLYHSGIKKRRNLIYLVLFLISFIALPLAFYLFNQTQGQIININNLFHLFSFEEFQLFTKNQENAGLNTIYFLIENFKFIFLFFVAYGIHLAVKHRQECRSYFIFIIMSLSGFFSYLLIKIQTFEFLISYEQQDYANRILNICAIFLLPFVFLALYQIISKMKEKNISIKIIFSILLIILSNTALYSSYPRFDRYHNSHGQSISKYDIEAVNWIEKNKETENYLVLANQQVSASALKSFGFKKYFPTKTGEIFYYPIPTSSPLYQYYLNMVYKKPTKKNMLEAMSFVGAEEGYFILNKYWWAFDKILKEAKIEADSYVEIGNGEIFIFKYK